MTKTFIEKLVEVQKELKAPKNQLNTFGNYNYRSAEDIIEAVKPLLHERGLLMTIADEMESISDRVYLKATVTVEDGHTARMVTGMAREALTKKGMDDSQITGATSSYARKYALNGMFAIDDTKDSDATNDGKGQEKKELPKPTSAPRMEEDKRLSLLRTINMSKTPDEATENFKTANAAAKEANDPISSQEFKAAALARKQQLTTQGES